MTGWLVVDMVADWLVNDVRTIDAKFGASQKKILSSLFLTVRFSHLPSTHSLPALFKTLLTLPASLRRVFAGHPSCRALFDSPLYQAALASAAKSSRSSSSSDAAEQEPQHAGISIPTLDHTTQRPSISLAVLRSKLEDRMATLVATSPTPLNMDNVFAQGHAPPSPAYSSPPHSTTVLSPKQKSKHRDRDDFVLRVPSSMSISSTQGTASSSSTTALNDASSATINGTTILRGDAPLTDSVARPAKDLAAFNSLLPPPVEFVEGSSSDAFAVGLEGMYEPVNASPKAAPRPSSDSEIKPKLTPKKKPSSDQKATPSLYNRPIDLSWPLSAFRGSGLYNTGNTCFLNSVLQCLLHTAPLVRMLLLHKGPECRVKSGFCMGCAMRNVTLDSFEKRRPFTPSQITRNLSFIAKHFKRGRQEDAHEFLRYAIDSLQKSCLAGYPPKIDHKLAETTWVHKIFGGRLRSRVTCQQCGYNSDTFDSMLDLSVDIYNMGSLKEALKRFTAKDYLKGADKYKCEKCKRPVNAEKRFTVHDAPMILTVHLKRFTPMGRKLQHPIRYEERLNLQPVMSEGQHGPTYNLYGVISHMGSGPNHGHYFAHIRCADGQWYEMNDESVGRVYGSEPLNMKNAYMLFYIREKGQALAAAVHGTGLINGMMPSNKRKVPSEDESSEGEDEDSEKTAAKSLIGPIIPAHLLSRTDPQPDTLRRKIEAAEREKKEKSAKPHQVKRTQLGRPQQQQLKSPKPLVEYEDASDEEEEQLGERVERPNTTSNTTSELRMTQNNEGADKGEGGSGGRSALGGANFLPSSSPLSPVPPATASTLRDPEEDPPAPSSSSPGHPAPPTSSLPATSPAEAISPSNFYGSSSTSTSAKRKSPDGDDGPEDVVSTTTRSRPKPPKLSYGLNGGNPFGKSRIGDNLRSYSERDEERELFRPRKVHKRQFGSRNKFAF